MNKYDKYDTESFLSLRDYYRFGSQDGCKIPLACNLTGLLVIDQLSVKIRVEGLEPMAYAFQGILGINFTVDLLFDKVQASFDLFIRQSFVIFYQPAFVPITFFCCHYFLFSF